jgi:3D (Asp-Asp-Asp) domain-containing protein
MSVISAIVISLVYSNMNINKVYSVENNNGTSPIIMVTKTESMVIEKKCLGTFKVSAYTAGFESTGKNKNDKNYGKTKTGVMVEEGITVASDWDVIKPGTEIFIEGVGKRIVQDAGGAIKGNRLDLYISDLQKAKIFGVKELKVYTTEIKRGNEDGEQIFRTKGKASFPL